MATRRATLAREIENMPVGLNVVHTPPRVHARFARDQSGPLPYVWLFSTTIEVTCGRPLRIERCGLATWRKGRWAYCKSTPPTVASFSLSCPSGWLQPEMQYIDESCLQGKRLKEVRLRWFIIARDADGKRYKGEADVELMRWVTI